MKVLLIMPYNCDLIHAVTLPLGLLSIASYLKQNGHDAKIHDMSVTHGNVVKIAEEYRPDIIGISLCSVKHVKGAIHITKKLRKLGVPIVWGGPFCDVSDPYIMLRDGKADMLSFSEGEETWLEIMNRLQEGKDLEGIKGTAILKNSELIKAPEREFLDPMLLPQLDFSLINVKAFGQYP